MFRVFTCTFVIYSSKAKTAWADSSSLVILGNLDVERLPIFSFLVYHGQSGKYLHHNYVSTLLNDLFGIQSRGGCACAGPYAMVSRVLFVFPAKHGRHIGIMSSLSVSSSTSALSHFWFPINNF